MISSPWTIQKLQVEKPHPAEIAILPYSARAVSRLG
jgi:hypothetical protein